MTALDSAERLQQAFDALSSQSALDKTRRSETKRALASIEGLLYHISFQKGSHRPDVAPISYPDAGTNDLFAWFLQTQDSFQYNIADHLVAFLSHVAMHQQYKVSREGHAPQADILALIRSSLQILQGCLLLHEPSRQLFSRRVNATILTQYLDQTSIVFDKTLTIEAIQTIVSALVDSPDNMRNFEAVDGLKLISLLFKDAATEHAVKVKILEFLYFYLIPETSEEDSENNGNRIHKVDGIQKSSTMQHHVRGSTASTDNLFFGKTTTRTSKEKQQLLSKYFHNIDALVRDLHEFKPFT